MRNWTHHDGSGRYRAATAANLFAFANLWRRTLRPTDGAPDCQAGANKLCQSKGFKEGKSLDTDAAEKCSPLVYLPGHKRGPNDCKTENYVTRALCQ